jgi:hypothetical protein
MPWSDVAYLRAISGGAEAPHFPDDWTMFLSTIDHKKLIATPPPNRVILIERASLQVL